MANGVNVKMGVSGVAQFKNNMNQAKQTVKTLDAQLALTEKQFKASGDSQEYMAKKTAELQAKLEAQKSVVENAEKALQQMAANGVDRSSTAYQGLYQQMLKAKGEMLDTENAMRGVETASDDAAEGAKGMNDQLAQIGRGIDWQNVESGLSSITSGMSSVIKKAWQMGQAIVQNTLGAGAWADELATTAAQYEITPDQLQRMRKTANLIDTDTETILDAQDKLKKNLEKQDKEGMGALAALGIDPTGKNSLDIFWQAGDAIAKLGKEEDRITYAQKLFGKSWRELLPLFNAGREEYDKTMASWSVVSDDQLESLGKMDDQYQKLTGEWETFKMEILGTFSGPLTAGMEKLTGFVQELNKYLETPEGQAMIKQMGDTITQLIEDLTKVSPEDVVNGLKGVVDGVTNALKWIQENSGTVIAAVEGFIGAWALLETAKGVSTALKLIDGIKGLTGTGASGGAASAASAGSTLGTSFATGFTNAFAAAAPVLASWLGIGAVAVAPALIAQQNDEKRWAEQYETRMTAANSMTGWDAEFMRQSAEALNQKYQLTGDSASLLMGMGDRGTIEKAKLLAMLAGESTSYGNNAEMELLRFWESGGEGWDQARTDALLTTITDSYARMAEATDVLTGGSNAAAMGNSEMAEATTSLKGMPAQVEAAVKSGLAGVKIYLDGQQITAYVDTQLAASVSRQ